MNCYNVFPHGFFFYSVSSHVFFQNYLCRFFFNIELVENSALTFPTCFFCYFFLKHCRLLQCFPAWFFSFFYDFFSELSSSILFFSYWTGWEFSFVVFFFKMFPYIFFFVMIFFKIVFVNFIFLILSWLRITTVYFLMKHSRLLQCFPEWFFFLLFFLLWFFSKFSLFILSFKY
jgi:hypothetical protein